MFTGIVETIGKMTNIQSKQGCQQFTIEHDGSLDDLKIGDSIAVNGTCLTVTELTPYSFHVDAVPETLRLTNLGQLKINDIVNLERSVTPTTRMGGHFVQGHVDTTANIVSIESDQGDAVMITFEYHPELSKYIAKKGYICIDGMSLTVVSTEKNTFKVTLIPHTQQVTVAKNYKAGHKVNLEVDMMAKQIEKLLGENKYVSSN